MRATELSKLLATTIPAGEPVMIKGPPGCGKSDIVAQAAAAAEAEVVLMHPVVSDPTDFKGLPAIVKGRAEFLPFGDLNRLVEATTRTVAFLDDLGQAPAVVQAAAMQLILARRVNGHKVSDNVTFIAATNRREDRAGVTGILEPVKSRFTMIIELLPNVEDWTAWALDNNVPTEVVAFVRFRPDLLTKPSDPTNDIVNRPSPRTVAAMGRAFKLGLTGMEALSGAVGEGFAAEFIGFLRTWKQLPNIDGIFLNPDMAGVPTEAAALYAVATAVASKCSKYNVGRAIKYLNRLPAEFSVLGVRDTARRVPEATRAPEFIKWATDHQNVLV